MITDREEIARIIDPWAFGIVANIQHTERAADDRAKALAKADAILARQGPGPGEAVADGWVMVPREPKLEILGAFWRVKNGHHFADEPPPTDTSDYAAYRAMIAASPAPAVSQEEIARIIDHEGYWERLDSCNHALATVSMTDDQRRNLTAVRDDERRGTASSLAKADAILSRLGVAK